MTTHRPRRHAMRRGLALVLALALLAALPRPAHAVWDPWRYLELVSGAEREFSDARFDDAIELYTEARAMLQEGLDGGHLPAEDLAGARVELARLTYQIARATQLAGHCAEAWGAFLDYLQRGELPDEIAELVPLRAVQSGACAIDGALDLRDIATAERVLAEVEALLAAHHAAVVDEALRLELEAARAELPALRTRLHESALALALEASLEQRCEAATDFLVAAERHAPTEATSLDSARGAVRKTCEASPPAADPPLATVDEPAASVGVGDVLPWVLLAGGIGLVGWGVAEEVRFSVDADAFAAAREDCLALQGDGSRCRESVRLRDALEPRRALSTGLLAGGAVLAAGGLTWWLLENLGADEPAAVALGLGPAGPAVDVRLRW